MKQLYVPTESQLKANSEQFFYEDPDLIIQDLLDDMETCPISSSIDELEKWVNEQIITRKVDTLWMHCTGTGTNATVTGITNYWRNNLGWKNPGYHVIFTLEGYTILQDLNLPTNGVAGHNARGIHISYIGGLEDGKAKDTRNVYQQQMFHAFAQMLRKKLPNINIRGHKEVSAKACPCFEVNQEFSYLLK